MLTANLEKIRAKFETRFVRGDGCWPWTFGLSRHGYGQQAVGGRTRTAHRVSYELYRGPIPPGLEIDHLCRNRACVNPDHLEPVTPAENNRRAWVLGVLGRPRSVACRRGHPRGPENDMWYGEGRKRSRICRACYLSRRKHGGRVRYASRVDTRTPPPEFVPPPVTP